MRSFVLLGVSVAYVTTFSVGQVDAGSLLRKAAARYREAKTFQIEWETKVTTSSEFSHGWSRQSYVVAADGPRFHWEVNGSTRRGLRISDGQNDWFYRPTAREYSIQSAVPEVPQSHVRGTAAGTAESWVKSALEGPYSFGR